MLQQHFPAVGPSERRRRRKRPAGRMRPQSTGPGRQEQMRSTDAGIETGGLVHAVGTKQRVIRGPRSLFLVQLEGYEALPGPVPETAPTEATRGLCWQSGTIADDRLTLGAHRLVSCLRHSPSRSPRDGVIENR